MGTVFDAVDVIRAKRDGGTLSDAQILGDRRVHPGCGGRGADVRAADGGAAARPVRGRAGSLDRGDDRLRRAAGSVRCGQPDGGQALDRWRGRQDHAAAGPAGRRARRRRTAAVRPRARAHRRHARQAGGDPGLAGGSVGGGVPGPAAHGRRGGRAAGASLAPADRKLYALRDVTGTVESIPLIASSIMSKKIAEGASALVLDVKVGSGAFMKSVADARALAAAMVSLGTAHGVRTVALLTDMSVPLGRTAGNGLEVAESVEVLAGGGPADVVELTLALAREMLAAAGLSDADPAALADGRAMDVWRRMIAAQGGSPDAPLPVARETSELPAPETGALTRLDAYAVGVAAWRLGAGRARKEDPVSAAAGVEMLAKPGDRVTAGAPLLRLHTDDPRPVPAGRRGARRGDRGRAGRAGTATPRPRPYRGVLE